MRYFSLLNVNLPVLKARPMGQNDWKAWKTDFSWFYLPSIAQVSLCLRKRNVDLNCVLGTFLLLVPGDWDIAFISSLIYSLFPKCTWDFLQMVAHETLSRRNPISEALWSYILFSVRHIGEAVDTLRFYSGIWLRVLLSSLELKKKKQYWQW